MTFQVKIFHCDTVLEQVGRYGFNYLSYVYYNKHSGIVNKMQKINNKLGTIRKSLKSASVDTLKFYK